MEISAEMDVEHTESIPKPPFTSQEHFWKQFLKGVNASTFLVGDSLKHKDYLSTPDYQEFVSCLNESLTSIFNRFIQEQNLEVSSVLQGVWALLLHRYSGEEDIIFGFQAVQTTLIASDKEDKESKSQLIPIRIKIEPSKLVVPWLLQVQEHWKITQAYSQVPLNQIQTWSDIPSDISMFETGIILGNLEQATALYNLPITIGIKIEPQLTLQVRYDRNRFQEAAINRLFGHFQTLLESLVTNPDQKLVSLPILTKKEQQQLLIEWNDTSTDYLYDKCIHQLFEEQVERAPDSIAIIYQEQQLTYRELNNRANQIAHYLQKLGVKPNALVGICVERSLGMLVGLLGILKSGCAYVPLDPTYPQERLHFMLQDTQVSVLLTSRSLVTEMPECDSQLVLLDADWDKIEQEREENLVSEVNPESLGYVIYTSGSTGKPKGVQMTQVALCNLILWQLRNTSIFAQAKTLQFSPISFDVSFQEIFSTWYAGGTLVLIDEEMRRDVRALLSLLKEQSIERLFLPFVALQQLAEASQASGLIPDNLQDIITAGEQLQITPAITYLFTNLPNARLHNHYGPSESHVVTAFTLNGSVETWSPLPPIGRAISNTHIFILDSHLQPVPIGIPGELYIGGACLSRGYLNRPELTIEKFIPNPFSREKAPHLYKTGDLARYLRCGDIEYLGRIDNQVKIRGFRIELGEVEATLCQHPSVQTAVVISREDIPGNKRLVAYIVPKLEQKPTINELRNFLKLKLANYMIPSAFIIMGAFPLTPSGKLDRRALTAPIATGTDVNFIAPNTTKERVLTEIWCDVLGLEQVGIEDNFFDIGGTSLLVLQIVMRVQKQLGSEFRAVKLYQYPTIRTFAQYLDREEHKQLEQSQQKNKQSDRLLQKAPKINSDGIAIIGMVGRFPGADTVEALWQNLCDGIESCTTFTDAEIDPSVDVELRTDPNYVRVRGIIDGAETFDASFFGISPREAEVLDPQARVFLELAYTALENAGYMPESYDGAIGLYAGSGQNTYFEHHICGRPEIINRLGEFQTMLANEKDFVTTRTSYKLGLTGPSLSINTACSTSLVAVIQAFQGLMSNQCDIALAGGVSITTPQNRGYLYQEGSMLSPDGRCRPFDANAQGTMFNSGAGIVILKRLEEALDDGDRIYAVIRGVGMNNDGTDKVSFTAPSVNGQAGAISMAQASAGIHPDTISYIETHGTATPLGDPIEIEALTQAFRTQTDATQFCAIGSIKSNFGHLVAAAGVTGLIKTALALYYKKIPPSLNFESPNPEIDFANSPFYVNNKLVDWAAGETPRRAGVSSFGVGGTNAHVVLEEAPSVEVSSPSRPFQLLRLSAKTSTALEQTTTNIKEYFTHNLEANLADVAYTLDHGRKAYNHRRFIVCRDRLDAIATLESLDVNRSATRLSEIRNPDVVFMFPGQGSQYLNMGKYFYEHEIVFRDAVDRCAEILRPLLDRDLLQVIYPPQSNDGNDEAATALLRQTQYTQPALFTIEYALALLWQSWGVRPAAMIGHSIGEFVAACLSGVFSLEDGLNLVATRARMMGALPSGSMLSVRLPAEVLQKRLSDDLAIAAVNGASLCVVAGPTEVVNNLQQQLEAEEIVCRTLHTSHAFHSPMMGPIIEPFAEMVKTVQLSPPKIPFVSTVTTEWITDAQATDPMYWASHLRATVRFAEGAKRLWEQPARVLLEVGPRTTTATLARQQAKDIKRQIAISSLGSNADNDAEWAAILQAVGQLWLAGVDLDKAKFYADEYRHRIPLPSYPFERKRYWIDPSLQTENSTINEAKRSEIDDWFYVPTWKQSIQSSNTDLLTTSQSPILVFVDECGLGLQLVTELENQKLEVIKVVVREGFSQFDSHFYGINPSQASDYDSLIQELAKHKLAPKTIIHLLNVTKDQKIDLTLDFVEAQQDISFYSLLHLIQSVEEQNIIDDIKILVVSNHLQSVNGEETINPIKATLLGPTLLSSKETSGIECRSVDIVLPEVGSQKEKKLIWQLLNEIQIQSLDKIVAYRGNYRWVQTFESVHLEPPKPEIGYFRFGGVYLITGGTGAVGLVLAKHLAQTVKAKLILTVRSPLPDRDQWLQWLTDHDEEDPISQKIKGCQELEALESDFLVVNADVTNLQQMETAITTAQLHFGRINGVIHAAGVYGSGIMQLKAREIAQKVLAPKVQGVVILDQIFKNAQLDFLILCSSLISIIPNIGQADYVAANACLDAYAVSQSNNNRFTISINWDTWKEVGMAAETLELRKSLNGSSLSLGLSSQEGVDIFSHISASGLSQVIVSTIDLHARINQFIALDSTKDSEDSIQLNPRQLSSQLDLNQLPQSQLQQMITKAWQEVLGIEHIGLQDNFFELGGDSLVAVQLLTKLRKTFISTGFDPSSIKLPISLVFEAPTIAILAHYCEGFQSGQQELSLDAQTLNNEDREEIEL